MPLTSSLAVTWQVRADVAEFPIQGMGSNVFLVKVAVMDRLC